LNLPLESVTRVLGSGDASEIKTKELITLAQERTFPDWQTIPRREDIAASLTEIISTLVVAETDGVSVSTAIQSAVVAGCSLSADKSASAITTAMRDAAHLPKPDPKPTSTNADSATPGGASSFGSGDKLTLETNLAGFYKQTGETPKLTDPVYAAPAGCKFFVSGSNKAKSYVVGSFQVSQYWFRAFIPRKFGAPAGTAPCVWRAEQPLIKKNNGDIKQAERDLASQLGANPVEPGREYMIAGDKLAPGNFDIEGYQAGVLVAPYKFHFSDHSTSGSASIGGYVGYNYGIPGFLVTPVLSAGLGAVPVPAATSTVKNPTPGATTTHTSFTLATGPIFGLPKFGGFQIGLLVGIDWAGAGADYKYEGKPWLSISFGTGLTGPVASK
jgi:hypothetical protein